MKRFHAGSFKTTAYRRAQVYGPGKNKYSIKIKFGQPDDCGNHRRLSTPVPRPYNSPMPQTYPLALVTGAAHRLGRVFALTLARQGYAILLHYHTSAAQAETTAQEIRALGAPVFPVQADLTDETAIERLFSVMDDLLQTSPVGPLAVLVNSAALMQRADARSLGAAQFDAALALNLRAPFLCAQRAFERMSAGGLIVNITDVAAQKTWAGYPAYTVSKSALAALTGVLARSFAPAVRVNAIAPGLVLPAGDLPPAEWQRLVSRLPLQRPAQTDEIASALTFLLQNQYITGQTVVVDGGYSLI
ncbi:MAG: SDR family oxidoreductase [Anaerolineales bacterium]